MDLILSGGAPYDGCFLEGCTDSLACNYNIEATYDDNTCEYFGENGDCENINLINYNQNKTKTTIITDILGRNIQRIQSGQLYLKNQNGKQKKIGSVESPKTGIKMDIITDQPGIQLYTGNFLDGSLKSK